jgi:hypothetical protein
MRSSLSALMALGMLSATLAGLALPAAAPAATDTPVVAAPVADAPVADARGEAVSRCTAMRGVDLSEDPQTPARVTDAAVTKIADDVPEVCMLDGYISPTTGFRIALPLQGWNGKYLQGGCGGACGTTRLFWCDQPLRRGYSCASTDMGHRSSTGDWDWAANDLQTKADFGFRATHLTALVGKALTARYFGRKPSRSYFFGCSTGGRQAMVEAENFPWDFDGIVAGSPPLDETGTSIQLAWTVRANIDADGKPILNETVVRLLHDAVLKKCDLNVGVEVYGGFPHELSDGAADRGGEEILFGTGRFGRKADRAYRRRDAGIGIKLVGRLCPGQWPRTAVRFFHSKLSPLRDLRSTGRADVDPRRFRPGQGFAAHGHERDVVRRHQPGSASLQGRRRQAHRLSRLGGHVGGADAVR